LYASTGLLADLLPSRQCGAEGIGLYRTEIPFMIRDRFPAEEEQRRIYRQPLEMFAPQPVTLRTLDIGGDKPLPYFPVVEDNPFLGWRGIRVMLDHPEIFMVQLRAMLRASSGLHNLRILLPMVSMLDELDAALTLIERTYRELAEVDGGILYPEIGVMIEVPASLYQISAIAQRVDFISIGSNDLTQYLFATDRNNERVARLYDALHPAVLRAVFTGINVAHDEKLSVGVCGEMAGSPAGALLLLGMGVDNLSVNATALPRIKWVIRNFAYSRAQEIVTEALHMNNTRELHSFVNRLLESAGLGSLVRAGK
jgi:phosphotransferase system enzyme I (PtsP)